MRCGLMPGEKKASPEDEQGEIWQSRMIDMDSRLWATRGIGADETQASIEVFQTLKKRGASGWSATHDFRWVGRD
jgi:hypothetical protein